MDKNLLEVSEKYLLKGEFEKLSIVIEKLDFATLNSLVIEIGYDNNNISAYSFICYLITKNENAELHSIASDLLVQPFGFLNGAYSAALFHVRRAIELDPDNLDYKQQLLFFHDIPDRLVPTQDAIKIAEEILVKRPDAVVVRNLLDFYKR